MASSIFALNASNGCAPTKVLPLMKNDGVPLRADLVALGQLGVDLRLPLARVEVGLELVDVEADLRRVLLQRRAIERLLVLEHDVVHLPELALGLGRQRRFGRRVRVVVERQRELLERDAHVLAVLSA